MTKLFQLRLSTW